MAFDFLHLIDLILSYGLEYIHKEALDEMFRSKTGENIFPAPFRPFRLQGQYRHIVPDKSFVAKMTLVRLETFLAAARNMVGQDVKVATTWWITDALQPGDSLPPEGHLTCVNEEGCATDVQCVSELVGNYNPKNFIVATQTNAEIYNRPAPFLEEGMYKDILPTRAFLIKMINHGFGNFLREAKALLGEEAQLATTWFMDEILLPHVAQTSDTPRGNLTCVNQEMCASEVDCIFGRIGAVNSANCIEAADGEELQRFSNYARLPIPKFNADDVLVFCEPSPQQVAYALNPQVQRQAEIRREARERKKKEEKLRKKQKAAV